MFSIDIDLLLTCLQYPNKVAEYITAAQLRELGIDKVVERDRNYKHSGFQETRRERKERETKEMRETQKEALEDVPVEEELAKPELPDLPSVRSVTLIKRCCADLE